MLLLNEINKINQIKTESKMDEYFNVFKINRAENFKEHFSKNILEILNKLIIASSSIGKQHPKNCWINNKKIYIRQM